MEQENDSTRQETLNQPGLFDPEQYALPFKGGDSESE